MAEWWQEYGEAPASPPPRENAANWWKDYKTVEPEVKPSMRSRVDAQLGRDEDVDYNLGIQNAKFRFNFSAMDSEEEKANFLERTVGRDNWGRTKGGDYWVSKPAAAKLGSPISTERERIAIDPDRLDAYDPLELPLGPIAGATAAGVVTGGAGFVPALLAAFGGGAAGSIIPELVEETGRTVASPEGDNAITQTEDYVEDIAPRAAIEGALSAGGEGIFRGLGAAARRILMGPQINRAGQTTAAPEALDLLKTSREAGIRPKTGMLTKNEPIRRGETYGQRVWGDPFEDMNKAALERRANALKVETGTGRGRPPPKLENTVLAGVSRRMQDLDKRARDMWESFENMVDGKPVVGTSNQREAIARIEHEVGRLAPEGLRRLKAEVYQTVEVPGPKPRFYERFHEGAKQGTVSKRVPVDRITPTQAWKRASMLRTQAKAGSFEGLAPKYLRDLKKAVEADMAAAANQFGHRGLNEARKWYAQQVDLLNSSAIKKLRQRPSEGGLPPEAVVNWLFEPGTSHRRLIEVRNAFGLRSPEWREVQDEAMDRLTEAMFRRGEGGLGVEIDGAAFNRALDKMGDKTLASMFGDGHAKALRQFGTLVEATVANPGGNAGNIAIAKYLLHPLAHLSGLAQVWGVRTVIRSPKFQKWMTEGFGTPEGRRALQQVMSTVMRPTVQAGMRSQPSALPRAMVPQENKEPAGGNL